MDAVVKRSLNQKGENGHSPDLTSDPFSILVCTLRGNDGEDSKSLGRAKERKKEKEKKKGGCE